MKELIAGLLLLAGAESSQATEKNGYGECEQYFNRLDAHTKEMEKKLSGGKSVCKVRMTITESGEITGLNLSDCPAKNRSEVAAETFKMSPLPMPDDKKCSAPHTFNINVKP